MITNTLFFASMNGFLLLPLYIQRLGGTEAQTGSCKACTARPASSVSR